MTDDDKNFLLKYVGARFEGTRLPVDVLSDLPAFRDLIVAFAKNAWRVNAGRTRVPKGFDKSISFDLVAIEAGSAVPTLNWNRSTAQANLPEFKDELEFIVDKSFNDVMSLIDNAGHDRFPTSLSSEQIRALNKLGSGLRDNERIEFLGTQGISGNVVFLDSYRRKKLITGVRETYEARLETVGRLLGAVITSDNQGHIIVETAERGNIEIPLDPERVKEEFDGNIYSDVQFDLQIEMDNADRLRSVIAVFDVSLIDAEISANLLRCRTRLNQIRELATGWHDGAGLAIDEDAFKSANRFLSKRPALSKFYRIFPTEDGGIHFEFQHAGWDLSVEVGPGGVAEIYGVQINGAAEFEPRRFDEIGDGFMEEFDRWLRERDG